MDDFTGIALNALDWRTRKDAVLKITDEDILKDIFINDSVVMVKIAAMDGIGDADFLYGECLNNPNGHIRMAILSRILDENLLESNKLDLLLRNLALNDPEDIVSQMSCENLNKDYQDVFKRIAYSKRGDKLRCRAISRIADEDILNDLALNDENTFIRLEAIQNPNLADVKVLARVIENDDEEFNRISAVMKIQDCESLFEIIFDESLYLRLSEIANNLFFSCQDCFMEILNGDFDEYHRIVAVSFIRSEDILESIISDCKNDRIIAEAVKNTNFKNQKILHDLIINGDSKAIVFEAIGKTDDEDLLRDYVKMHPSAGELTFRAISRITDFEFLESLYDCEDTQIRLHAAKRMIELKYNLASIAVNFPDRQIRLEAVGAMSDKYMLAKIAAESDDRDIITAALDNIVSEKLIKQYMPQRSLITGSIDEIAFKSMIWKLATKSEDIEIRKSAISKLEEKDVLDEIIENSDDCELVEAAENRLDTLWQDIRLIDDEDVLNVIAQKGDDEIKAAVSAQIEDLKTWKSRIAEITGISDTAKLKDIANNDYNYFVRCEAEGKLESLIFSVRLDEVKLKENQDMFRRIADDESYPLEIRRKASLMLLN